ncbi:MAG: BON domain-containing protein [Acidobacteriaceae bacterium]|nr:BON domain-containing protein [Acidobacteriaceae bacterium]
MNTMHTRNRVYFFSTAFFLSFGLTFLVAQEGSEKVSDADQQQIVKMAEGIRKAIVTLPQYGVFDYLHFGIKNRKVTLFGYASRPILKSSAENVTKKVPGVESVDNQIKVLPLSPNDDRIRAAVYFNIYSYPMLQKYTNNRGPGRMGPSVARRAGGITNDPPIGWHAISIIVENGNVILKGVVDNASDFAVAEMRANITSGVFSVDNDLEVVGGKQK